MDLDKRDDRSAVVGEAPTRSTTKPRGWVIPTIAAFSVAAAGALMVFDTDDDATPARVEAARPARVEPAAATKPAAAAPSGPAAPAPTAPAPTTYVRFAFYVPFDPLKQDDPYGRVQDQWGCWRWTRLAGGGRYEETHLAYRKDGRPDCPAEAMPEPFIDYLPEAEATDLREDVVVVSRTVVKAGDPELVEFFRKRRDAATTND